MKILLAIDESKFSEAATQAVMAQLRPDVAEVCVLHVVEWAILTPDLFPRFVDVIEEAQRENLKRAKAFVERTAQKLSAAGIKVCTAVREGEPKTTIIDYAEEWGADLIILGSHGQKGLERMLLGSVSEAVARHAHCSVEIVRVAKQR